jgi:hypothetical protein
MTNITPLDPARDRLEQLIERIPAVMRAEVGVDHPILAQMNAAEAGKPTMSREAMIQQAVLNALPTYEGGGSWRTLGTIGYLSCLFVGSFVRCTLVDAVRVEFAKLAEKYA